MRAVILTAIPVEYAAARKHLEDPIGSLSVNGAVFETGTFTGTNSTWEVLLAETGPTNPSSAIATERAIGCFDPEVALFVGVAGGIKDVAHGDVVAANKVYWYEAGKASKRFKPRPSAPECSHKLREIAKAVARERGWHARIKAPGQKRGIKVLVKPIASGEKVVDYSASIVAKLVQQSYGDAVAFEMEGYGFMEAALANEGVSALVVRGVSDLLDDKSLADSRGRQGVAAANASAFAFEMLDRFGEAAKRISRKPQVRRLPILKNPNFIGRRSELSEIEEHLKSANRVAVVGAGGMGKTQLAAEFVYRNLQRYDVIWWVRAEDVTTLEADMADLVVALRQTDPNAKDPIQPALDWLEGHNSWLLVFDSATSPATIYPYLPRSASGDCIVTSSHQDWSELARTVPVGPLPQEECRAYLTKRTGRRDKASADQIIAALGHHPLALAQASAYIAETGLDLREYSRLLSQQFSSVAKLGPAPLDHPDGVFATVALAVDRLTDHQAVAAELIKLLAHWSSDDIPKELVRTVAGMAHGELAAAASDELQFNQLVRDLRHYSLVEVRGDAFAIHGLVQASVRDRLSTEDASRYAELALGVTQLLPWADEEHASFTRLIPHVIAAAGVALARGVSLGQSIATFDEDILGRWIDRYPEPQRSAVANRFLEQLRGALSTSEPKIACWTVAALGFRRDDIVDRLLQIADTRDDDTGDTALATVAALGLPDKDRFRVLQDLHARILKRPNRQLVAGIAHLSEPDSVSTLKQICAGLSQTLEREDDDAKVERRASPNASIA